MASQTILPLKQRIPRFKRSAFTLIDLLVVLSIIALLVGILLPALGRARDAAKSTVCLSHLRTLGQAMGMYHVDHRMTYPQPGQESGFGTNAAAKRLAGKMLWFNALDYYVQQSAKNYSSGHADQRNFNAFKQDPAWSNLPSAVSTSSGMVVLDPEKIRTLKMNEYFGYLSSATTPSSLSGNPIKFFRLTALDLPSKTVLFIDGRGHDTQSLTTGHVDYAATTGGGSGLFYAREAYVAPRHQGGANAAHADGAAAFHLNPVKQAPSSGYPCWYNDDDSNLDRRPDLFFNFDRRS
ncbi:MAG: type II secretion system protein [Algisphaera sp.]